MCAVVRSPHLSIFPGKTDAECFFMPQNQMDPDGDR